MELLIPIFDERKNLLNTPYKDLLSLCKKSERINYICDINFWIDYLTQNIPEKINIPKGVTVIWCKEKLDEYPKLKKMEDLIKCKKVTVTYITKIENDYSLNVQDIFERAKNIKILYCMYNNLTELGYYPNLEGLYCEYNKIKSLPYYPKLKILSCQYNNITIIPPYQDLLELYCDGNKIITLPYHNNLRILRCYDNNLIFIPFYPNLEILDCRYNNIICLHSYLKLQKLKCENNNIVILPYYPELRKLSCKGNPLSGFTLEYWKKIWKTS